MQLLIFYPIINNPRFYQTYLFFFIIFKLLKNKKNMAGGRISMLGKSPNNFELPKAFATGS